jgi:hypothetical protein
MTETSKQARKPPKGGRKGGTRFPNVNLQKALEYAKKLVSKTHNGPQPEQTILVGVFNNKGSDGKIRASALKQYALLEGDTKGYAASRLAREIEAAMPQERPALMQQAFLSSKIFKQVYDTLRSETASRARVRQVVISGEVHPDLADGCVTCFIDGAVYAGLGTLDGENVALTDASAAPASSPTNADNQAVEEPENGAEESDAEHQSEEAELATNNGGASRQTGPGEPNVRINLTVDSSSDPDKLEKQLKLLKQYGLLRP